MKTTTPQDAAMELVCAKYEASGMSLQELGVKMGFPEKTARMGAHQALKAGDPRISTLRRFAAALAIPIEELVAEKKKGQPKKG